MTVFGLLDLDGRGLLRERLDAMAVESMLLRPATLSQQVRSSAAVGAHSDSTALRGVESSDRVVVAVEGRIENRSELERELDVEPGDSDALLLIRAYGRWGPQCASHVAGPFVFALWDGERRRLLCARDALGIRPFYYTVRPGEVVFGSQLRQVLATLDHHPDLDEAYFALFLLDGLPAPATTPYQGIRKLPPGKCLIVEGGRAREERHWRPDELPPTLYADPRDYAAHYLELFKQAVEVNLRANGPVWADLSGGLDSSSIVCVAQELMQEGEIDGSGFATLTVEFDETRSGDEEKYSRSVLDKYRDLDARSILADSFCVFADMAEGARYYDEPSQQIRFFTLFQRYREMLAANGAKALLRGSAAEVGLLTEYPLPLHLLDLLRSLRLRRFTRDLLAWQKALRIPLINLLAQCVLRPLMGPPLNKYYENPEIPAWIDRSFAARTKLAAHVNHGWMPRRFKSVGNQWQYEKAGRASSYFYRGYMEAIFENRYPFLYRPLVDYCLSIPYEHKILPGHFKPLLRRAMAGILPDEIRFRMDKGEISHWVVSSLARQWPALAPLLENSVLAELGFVDRDELYRAAHMFAYGQAKRTTLTSAVIGLEIWTRHTLGQSVPESLAGAARGA